MVPKGEALEMWGDNLGQNLLRVQKKHPSATDLLLGHFFKQSLAPLPLKCIRCVQVNMTETACTRMYGTPVHPMWAITAHLTGVWIGIPDWGLMVSFPSPVRVISVHTGLNWYQQNRQNFNAHSSYLSIFLFICLFFYLFSIFPISFTIYTCIFSNGFETSRAKTFWKIKYNVIEDSAIFQTSKYQRSIVDLVIFVVVHYTNLFCSCCHKVAPKNYSQVSSVFQVISFSNARKCVFIWSNQLFSQFVVNCLSATSVTQNTAF